MTDKLDHLQRAPLDADKTHKRLDAWCHEMRMSHLFHQDAAATFGKRGRYLSVGTLIISTVVGTAIFASLAASPATGWKVAAGVLTGMVAVLSALQALLKYPELAARHRQASLALSQLVHRVDIELTKQSPSVDTLETVQDDWHKINIDTPDISQRARDRITKQVDRQIESQERKERAEG
ncbi:SLATT domain-containing protein [Streptomyces sp. NBC_00885]|uniref:SLATT domain-containing protein n=1 Tax=Streptomyces sp. NBC_00885 TaxID=2975857 RepID=UPI0038630E76|nr:SLATT domain-containing protein [Streptomyces sp. NBC_00885]